MKITGIGGIFFKAEDPQKLKQWYQKNLGINQVFYWNELDSRKTRYTAWNTLATSAAIFADTTKAFVISYVVEDLDLFLATLANDNVPSAGSVTEDENGKFGYVFDPDGNKIILWQPSDKNPDVHNTLDKVTGLGGVFFKSNNAAALKEWYAKHLGFVVTEWGSSLEWIDPHHPDATSPAATAWNIFKGDSKHFAPSEKQFMFNYRVKDLITLFESFKKEGVELVGKVEEYPYGKFGWIMDPEGNKIELWEPIDSGF